MTNPIYGHSPHPAGTMFGYDNDTNEYVVVDVNSNGELSVTGKPYAEIVVISGVYVYCAQATVGSIATDAVWQAYCYDTTGPIIKTWADGNENFDNQADNLAGLSYS